MYSKLHSSTAISETDKNRHYLLIMMVGIAGSAFLLIFGFRALLDPQYIFLGSMLLCAMTFALISMSLMWWSGQPVYGVSGISIAVILVYVYLIATGGIDNTGPLWCYPLTLIITLLLEFRKGIIALLLLSAINLLLMYYPDLPYVTAEYTQTFKIRFIASFTALAIMSSIYKYLRFRTQNSFIALNQSLHRASRTDPLTGLANRREMEEQLDGEIERYKRCGIPFTVIMVDLDRFKSINDRYGHTLGDKLLELVSQRMTEEIRREDLVSRWGGEEFLVMLSSTRLEHGIIAAEKLRIAIETIDLSDFGVTEMVSASFGVQCITETKNLECLIVEVDNRLYQAKRQGRNRVVSEFRIEDNNQVG